MVVKRNRPLRPIHPRIMAQICRCPTLLNQRGFKNPVINFFPLADIMKDDPGDQFLSCDLENL
jgi:hypothetical protein